MFRGNHPAKVDEKGRLKLPSAFKQLMDAQNETQFYITSPDGKSAQIWPLSEWIELEKKLAANIHDESIENYVNWTSYYGQQVEIDNQSRLTLPQLLREDAKLTAEVAVIGKTKYVEVKNEEMLKQDLAARPVNAVDRQKVAAVLEQK
jgi:MraZ protein